MMAHTPGPWTIYRTTDGRAILGIGDADAGGITDAHFGFWRSGEEYEANARLIASAPDLLEALRIMVDAECSYMRLNNLGDPEKNDRIRLSRAAIAKAEGR